MIRFTQPCSKLREKWWNCIGGYRVLKISIQNESRMNFDYFWAKATKKHKYSIDFSINHTISNLKMPWFFVHNLDLLLVHIWLCGLDKAQVLERRCFRNSWIECMCAVICSNEEKMIMCSTPYYVAWMQWYAWGEPVICVILAQIWIFELSGTI